MNISYEKPRLVDEEQDLGRDPHDPIKAGDLGEEIAPGFYIKFLPPKNRGEPKPAVEAETVEPQETLHRKPLHEREKLVEELAARLMDYYIANLNNQTFLNPIRDGIPQCVKHPFKRGKSVGCVHSCRENILPVVRDYTLYDVFLWVKELLTHVYKNTVRTRPELRGLGVRLD
jgi:hypothetical protein